MTQPVEPADDETPDGPIYQAPEPLEPPDDPTTRPSRGEQGGDGG
jgi:hypothetical protein